jgi:hypothetical protein
MLQPALALLSERGPEVHCLDVPEVFLSIDAALCDDLLRAARPLRFSS